MCSDCVNITIFPFVGENLAEENLEKYVALKNYQHAIERCYSGVHYLSEASARDSNGILYVFDIDYINKTSKEYHVLWPDGSLSKEKIVAGKGERDERWDCRYYLPVIRQKVRGVNVDVSIKGVRIYLEVLVRKENKMQLLLQSIGPDRLR